MTLDNSSDLAVIDVEPNLQAFFPAPQPQLDALKEKMFSLPQIDMPVTHHFAKDVYLREVFHPAGVAVIGYKHRTDHLFLLVKGTLTIINDEQNERLDVEGPCVLHTKPGAQRMAYAHTDCVVMTIHVTQLTDPHAIMDAILVPEPGSTLPSPGTSYLHDFGEVTA